MIIARERGGRPSEYPLGAPAHRVERCPFCAGHEDLTPQAVEMYPRDGDQRYLSTKSHPNSPVIVNARPIAADANWQVRVIPNKYPAVSPDQEPERLVTEIGVSLPGFGVHEVIIESQDHTTTFSEITSNQAFWSCLAYRDRLAALREHSQIRAGLLFKNCRGAGGATLEHTHSQLIATSIVPPVIGRELQAAEAHRQRTGDCIFCSTIALERSSAERLIATTKYFSVFCPYASRFAYEVWIVPNRHEPSFEGANLAEIEELSVLLQRVIRALEKITPQLAYNYWIHSTPFDSSSYDYYHWHLELISRSTTQAGFEWGTGCFVNPIPPEDAATALRATWE